MTYEAECGKSITEYYDECFDVIRSFHSPATREPATYQFQMRYFLQLYWRLGEECAE